MVEINTTLGQVGELELKSFKNKLKKIKKDLGISQNTKLKDDKIVKRKEELIVLLNIIGRTAINVLCMDWFCDEDGDYIYQELSNIEKRLKEVDNKLIDVYTTIMKSIDKKQN